MARIIPPDYNAPNNTGLPESERQTLIYLEEALPDSYTVFSSVLWARSHAHNTRFGELDFCVVAPNGQLVVIEQKSGGLTVRDGSIYKRYGVTEKDAGAQLLRAIAALKSIWQRQHHGQTVAIDYLLYLPDYHLRQLSGLQLDASRIVHSGSTHSLAETLQNLCEHDQASDLGRSDTPAERVRAMHNFLTGALELELDIGRLQSHQERFYRRHEDSLMAWVSRLHFAPYILRVDGCAGSGKTQLAVGLMREASNRGERARYICFNRPLADSLALVMEGADHIQSRDHFYRCFLHAQHQDLTSTEHNSAYFEALEARVAELPVLENWLTDLLIIDEGQDMPQRSLDVLRRFLRPDGRLVWLEDRAQNLYGHSPVELKHAVELRLDCQTASKTFHLSAPNTFHFC